VILWLNKIGPYHNPHETYSFYQLPFCKPPAVKGEPETREGGLGEILEGHDFIHSGMKMGFKRTFRAHMCLCVCVCVCVV
jgi:transmembrane 9 superfamily protein 3